MVTFVEFPSGNGGVVYLSIKGITWGCRPIFGCRRFLFFRPISQCSLSEAFEGRLPRPGGIVDGKFFYF